MTREDFNDTCNTILSWVKEAVGTAVKPALDLTWEIITTNRSSILSTPSSCSQTEECSVVICPFPSSSRSKSALLDEVVDEHGELPCGSNRSRPSRNGGRLLVEPVVVLLGGSQENVYQCIQSEIDESISNIILSSEHRDDNLLKALSSSKTVSSDIFEVAIRDINAGLSYVLLQATCSRSSQVAREMLCGVSVKLLPLFPELTGKVFPSVPVELQRILESKLPHATAQVIVSVIDTMINLCGQECTRDTTEGQDYVNSQLSRFLHAVSDRIKDMILKIKSFSPQPDKQPGTSKSMESLQDTMPYSKPKLLLSTTSSIDQSCSSLIKLCSYCYSTPDFNREFSDLEQERQVVQSPQPSMSRKEVVDIGDIPSAIWGQSKNMEFHKIASMAVSQILENTVNEITTLFDSTICTIYQGGSPSIKLPHNTGEAAFGVVDIILEGVRTVIDAKKDFLITLTDPILFWEQVQLVSDIILQMVQAKLKEMFTVQLLLTTESNIGFSQHGVVTCAKEILSRILVNIKKGLPTCELKGSREALAKQFLDSLIHNLELLITRDVDQQPQQGASSCFVEQRVADNSTSIIAGTRCSSSLELECMVSDVRPITTNLYHAIVETANVLSKDSIDFLTETVLIEKAQQVMLDSSSTNILRLAISNSQMAFKKSCPEKEDLQKQLVLDFVKTSVGNLLQKCLGLSASQDESQPFQHPASGPSQKSIRSIPGWVMSKLKGTKTSVETVSATALITTTMVQEVMGSVQLTRDLSVDASVCLSKDTSNMSLPLEDIQCYEELVTECDIGKMAEKPLDTEADCPGTGLKTVNWRERVPYFMGFCQKKAQTMPRVSLAESLASDKTNSQFGAEVPRAIALSVVPAISTAKTPEPSLTSTKAQGKTTKNRRERSYFPSCCPQKEPKKAKVSSVDECSSERIPHYLGLSQKKPETMSLVSLASDKTNSQEDVQEFQATSGLSTEARTPSPVELISNGSVHSVMNALLSKAKENSVKSVLELHQAVEEFSAEVPRAIALSVVPAISTDKIPEPSLTITKAQGKTTKNRRDRFDFPSCCLQKEQKKDKVSSVSTLSDKAKFVDDVYQDLLQEKGSAIKLCQSVEQLHLAVEECSAGRLHHLLGFSKNKPETMSCVSLTKCLASDKNYSQEDVQEFQATSSQCTVAGTSSPVELISNGSVHSVMNALLSKAKENSVKSVLELHQAVDECSAERFPHLLDLSQNKPETMSCVSLAKSLDSDKTNPQEDFQEFQATSGLSTEARTPSPVELISNGSVHSVMNALLSKAKENSVKSVLELHQAVEEFSAEVPRAIALSVVPAISTDKIPEPSLTITKAQGKTTKNRRDRLYFPSCCLQKEQKKDKVSSVSTLSDKAKFVDDVYQDLLQEKGSAIKLCQSVEQLHLAVDECSAERFPHLLDLSQNKPETMSRVSLAKSLDSDKTNPQEDFQEFQATSGLSTEARTPSPVELISNGSVHSVMNALLSKAKENSVKSVLELHQAVEEFSAEVPRAIALSVVPAISTDKIPEPSLTITKAQGKTTKNRRERSYFPSCCLQKEQKKDKVSSVSTLSDKAKFVDDVYQDLLQEKGSAIKLCQSVEQLHLAVDECSAERFPHLLDLSQNKPETMSRVSLAKSLDSDKTNPQEDFQEFQATSGLSTEARTPSPVELISNGSVHSVMNALLSKAKENSVKSVLELHQAVEEFSAEVPRAIALSVVPAISTDKIPEPSLTITKAQGKTTNNRRDRLYFPSCCLQKEQKKDKVSSVSTLSDKAIFVDDVYQDLLQKKGSAIKLCQSVEQLHLAVDECSAERFPHLLDLSQNKPETMSCVSLAKSLDSDKTNPQEDFQEFQATSGLSTEARTPSPVELISNGSVHSVMNALLSKAKENSVKSVLELHQAVEEFSAEVPRAIALSVVPAISTDKIPEPSLTITKAQGKTTKNRRDRLYFPSCCLQKEQKKDKVSSVSTLSDKAKFVDDVYQDLLQEKGSAIKLCQSVEQLHLAVDECSAERFPHLLDLSQNKPETMSRVSLAKSLDSDKTNPQEDFQEFQATSGLSTEARTPSPVELISNGSVHSVMNALLSKAKENSVKSVLELHQAVEEFSAEVPRAIALSVVPAISTDKIPEPSLTITKAQGKTTKNRRERSYFPSCCLQKEQKKDKVSSVSTLSDKAKFVDDVYQDLLQEKGSAIKLCQSVEQLHLAVDECSAERFPHLLDLSQNKPETMSRVSLAKSLDSDKTNPQEDFQEFQATSGLSTEARTPSPVELISNGSVHSVMNALLSKAKENSVKSVLELHQAVEEFSAEVPRAIALSVVPAISTDKIPEPSLTITKAQGKTTNNRRDRLYFPSCCLQKEQKKDKVSSVSTLSDKAIFVDDVYQDLLQKKGSAIKLCQSVEQLHLAVDECSAERFPHLLDLSQNKPETMSCVSLAKSLDSDKTNPQEDFQEFQATSGLSTEARTPSPVELISNGSVHSVMNALLSKAKENSVKSVLELHQAVEEFSAEVPRAIALSVVPAISTDKIPEPSLTITKAQGKTTKNRRDRLYFPSCCLQKEQKKDKVSSVSTLSDKAKFVDDVYQDLLQEKGSAIKLCQSVEQLHLAVDECSAERFPHLLDLSQNKPETMSRVSLAKSLDSDKTNPQEDFQEFQATSGLSTEARTPSPVELISNGSVHSVMNALLSKAKENSVKSVLELHQAVEEFSAEVPRAIALSVVPAISTDKIPEPSLTITKAQGKTTKNRRERSYFPSCCLQKEQKKDKVSSVSTLSDKAKFVDDVYQDLLQEKGSAIKLCQSVEQLHLAVDECSAERFPHLLDLSQNKPETMSRVSLAKSLDSDKTNPQEDFQEFQATSGLSTEARTPSPVELISNGSVHSVMNALLSKAKENSVKSVLELHQAVEEFSAEVPRAIALSVVPAISTDKIPEPSLTITKAQGKTTKNRRERSYFPSCCSQKEQKKDKVSLVSTLSDKAMFVDNICQDLLQEKGSAIKLCQSVEQLHLPLECSAERFPHFFGLSQKKPETMSSVSLAKNLASDKYNSQEDVQEFQATSSQCTVARSSSPLELISNGSVHSVMNALLLKVEEDLIKSVLDLHQVAGGFSAEVHRAIAFSVVPGISTDKIPEPSLTITKAQGKTTKNRRERSYFPSCCPQKAQKKAKVSSVSTLSDKAKFDDDVCQDLLQEKGSAIELCQSVEQLHLAVEECSTEVSKAIASSVARVISVEKMAESSLNTIAQGKQTNNRQERSYFPSFCLQKKKKLNKTEQSFSTLSNKANSSGPQEVLPKVCGSATPSLCNTTESQSTATGTQSTPVVSFSSGSVHSLVCALLLKIRKNADGSPPQSEPELIEKALSVSGSVLTLLAEVNGMSVDEESSTPSRAAPDEVVEAVYKDLLQEKGSAIELHQAVEQCSAEVPRVIAWSLVKEISTAPPNEFLAAPAFLLSSVLLLSGHPSKAISLSGNAKSLAAAASNRLPKDESQKRFGLLPKLPKTHKMQKMPKLKAKNKVDPLAIYPSFDLLREDPLEDTCDHS